MLKLMVPVQLAIILSITARLVSKTERVISAVLHAILDTTSMLQQQDV
jgi:hypothetical protein